MNRIVAVFIFILVGFTTEVNAQIIPQKDMPQHKTGDAQLDNNLAIINLDAKKDFGLFEKGMASTHNVPESKIETMSKEGMDGGDIYMACEVSKITKKPLDEVVKVYKANKAKGWGAISKELGIKPGSAEFKALKNSADTKAKKSKSNQKEGKAKPKEEKAKPKNK